MNNSRKALMVALLLALVGAGAVRAQLPPNVVIEGSIETTTDAVVFPASPDGRVYVRGCMGCQHDTLQLDKNTQCILAGRLVSLRELASNAPSSVRALTISYRLRDLVVSRIVIMEK